MNPMTEFQFHTTAVRIFPTEDGQSFFAVAADVAAALGYPSANHMLRGIDEEDKGCTEVCTPGGTQRMLTINESGVYDATFRSRNPSAKPFRRWITAEILPSIRKTGSYARPGAAEPAAAVQLALAQELGKLLVLTGQVVDVYRLLDGSRVGHLRAEAKITRLPRRSSGGSSPRKNTTPRKRCDAWRRPAGHAPRSPTSPAEHWGMSARSSGRRAAMACCRRATRRKWTWRSLQPATANASNLNWKARRNPPLPQPLPAPPPRGFFLASHEALHVQTASRARID